MGDINAWPYLPTVLSDLIERETLSVLLTGCHFRLGRALTVLDYNDRLNTFHRVDPLIEHMGFDGLCSKFRNEDFVKGGNQACAECDENRAHAVIRQWQQNHQNLPQNYICHLGLTDYSAVICVKNIPVAVMLAGQFAPPNSIQRIQKRIRLIGEASNDRDIRFLQDNVDVELVRLAEELTPPPDDFAIRMKKEVNLLQQLAEDRYQKDKHEKEQEFLNDLRISRRFGEVKDLRQIREETVELLERIRHYCDARYIVLYTNVGPDDTVLTPIAQSGFSEPVDLPHFNWRKAGLPEISEESSHQFILSTHSIFERGIRGRTIKSLADASCAVASSLGQAYRAFMVFGPINHRRGLETEQEFLNQVSRIVGWSVSTKLQSLRLHDEQERRKATEILLQHRVRTALTPITTHTAMAKTHLERYFLDQTAIEQARDAIRAVHELTLGLGKTVKETPRSIRIMVETEDLKLEAYPLSVLVANCAIGFEQEARKKSRKLVIESSIENLPTADVDIARLTIAISNILDNAVKYSFPNTTIYVRNLPVQFSSAHETFIEIQIEDLGEPIPSEKMRDIFERGERALVEAKMGKIPGTGYGLWESKAVIVAHRGDIVATSEPTRYYNNRPGAAHKVTFNVRIPVGKAV